MRDVYEKRCETMGDWIVPTVFLGSFLFVITSFLSA